MKKIAALALAGLIVLALAPASQAQMQANKLVLDGSTTVGPIAKAFAEEYMRLNPGVNITVSESGSGNGAKSIVNGTCDIANMSRFMKDTEFKAAADAGRMPVAHVVALDGLPVLGKPTKYGVRDGRF